MAEHGTVRKNVLYILDKNLISSLDLHPHKDISGRASLVHNLIEAYGLLNHMALLPSKPATKEDLMSFHSSSYVEFLANVSDINDLEKLEDEQLEFGLGYDCPLFEEIFDFVCYVAGGSLTAASYLADNSYRYAINWCGGWHHTQRDSADGFCYVNDIVIAIQKLLERFNHVLYIDLDVHHGNGVENAFCATNRVSTLSLHKYEPGFYPSTGDVTDVGISRGKYYTVNVPLKDGIRDDKYYSIFSRVLSEMWSTFHPDAVVVQCGADCLSRDPLGGFNLTPQAVGSCVRDILAWKIPALFLGGGGYDGPNAARHWTYLKSVIVNQNIPLEIPETTVDFEMYGPGFELEITPGNRQDLNTDEYIEALLRTISENLKIVRNNQT